MSAIARDLYVAMSCSTRITCRVLDHEIKRTEKRIQKYGAFRTERVFETRNDYPAGVVFRVRAAD